MVVLLDEFCEGVILAVGESIVYNPSMERCVLQKALRLLRLQKP